MPSVVIPRDLRRPGLISRVLFARISSFWACLQCRYLLSLLMPIHVAQAACLAQHSTHPIFVLEKTGTSLLCPMGAHICPGVANATAYADFKLLHWPKHKVASTICCTAGLLGPFQGFQNKCIWSSDRPPALWLILSFYAITMWN